MSAAAPSFQVLQQAAEWYAALGAPSVDAAERQRWRQWHDADPAHQQAWRQVEAISGKFLDLPGGNNRWRAACWTPPRPARPAAASP